MKNNIFTILFGLFVLFLIGCSDDGPATPKIQPVIEADRQNVGYNDEVKVMLTVDGQPATGYNFDWNCDIGEIVSGQNSNEIVWKSPEFAVSGEVGVTVTGDNVDSPGNLVVSAVAPFYDDCSGNTSHWSTNYLKLIDSDDDMLHFKGQSYENSALMYTEVNSASFDSYVIKSRLGAVRSVWLGGYEYGIYFKTRDTLSFPVYYNDRYQDLKFYSYLFVISNIDSLFNFYTIGYTELGGTRKWIGIDSDLAGYDESIVTEFNHFHEFTWTVHPDKLIEIKFGQNTVATSALFMMLNSRPGINYDFFPSFIGFRTVYETEVAVDGISIEEYRFIESIPKSGKPNPGYIKAYDLEDLGINSMIIGDNF